MLSVKDDLVESCYFRLVKVAASPVEDPTLEGDVVGTFGTEVVIRVVDIQIEMLKTPRVEPSAVVRIVGVQNADGTRQHLPPRAGKLADAQCALTNVSDQGDRELTRGMITARPAGRN